jgi:hypothetical protein
MADYQHWPAYAVVWNAAAVGVAVIARSAPVASLGLWGGDERGGRRAQREQ